MTTLPDVILEASFTAGASTSTYLHLDDAARGKLDTGTLAPADIWADISAYFRTITTRRGANRGEGPVLRYEAGTAAVALRNEDRRFDGTNLGGPYVASGRSQVTPMRQVRMLATWAGVTYDLWRGFADKWAASYTREGNYSEVLLTCTDGFKVFAADDRVAGSAVGAGEDAGARVSRILDSVSWPDTDRVIATGDSTLQATTLDGAALTELFLVTDSEIGEGYIDGAGRFVFRNRKAIFTDARSNTSQATFGDDGNELRYTDIEIAPDDTTLANIARIARTGGTQQTATDSASIDEFLTHVHERTDLLLETDTESLNYAQFIVHQSSEPELRVTQLTIDPLRDPANLFPQVLGRQIGDRITVRLRPPGAAAEIAHVADAETLNDTSTTSVTVNVPAGTVAGDVMIALIGQIQQQTITAPDDWTLIGTVDAGSNVRYAAYHKVAGDPVSEPADYTWSWGTNIKNSGWIGAYSGVSVTDPIDTWDSAGTGVDGDTHDTPSVVTSPDAWLITGILERHPATGSATTWTTGDASDAERLDHGSNAGSGQDLSHAVYDSARDLTAGAHSRTLTSSQTVSQIAAFSIALRPAGGGTVIERDVFIRGISHQIAPKTWRTMWALQSASKYKFLILDHATLGRLDDGNALAY